MKEDELQEYWDYVALEAKDFERALRLEKWKGAARNWLADYADKRAKDFILKVVNEVIKLDRFAKVLDIGCGSGKWSIIFAKKCSSVTAIDINPNMVLLAEENAKKENLKTINFHVMDVSRLNIPDETHDLVNCVTVLQHIFDDDNWRRAIQEIARVAKNGGYILLFEVAPNIAIRKRTPHLSVRTMRQYINEFEKAKTHLVYWRAVDLSLPITFFGLKNYAASFSKKVYYFVSGRKLLLSGFLSFLSWITVLLARLVDYRLAETPLSFLSFGRILLFQKTGNNVFRLNRKQKSP